MPNYNLGYDPAGVKKDVYQQMLGAYNTASNVPYGQGQFAGTPFEGIQKYLGGQWQGSVLSGNKSQQTEYGRQLDDLMRFFSIMGGGPNEYFNIAAGNINRAGATAGAEAQRTAGSMAGARNLVNPSAFTLGAGTQARQPYVQALGGLEAQRAQAQQQFLAQLLQYLTGQGQQRGQQNMYAEQNQFDWSSLLPVLGQIGAAVI